MRFISTPTARLGAATLACAAIVAPAVALAAPSAPARTAAPAVTPSCETPGLVIWLNTKPGGGTAGSTFYHLEITNLSGGTCTLNGFPFLFAVNLTGGQVGHRATFSSVTPHLVTLVKGQTVHALLQVVHVANFPPATCHPVTAAGFKVFPPNQQRAKVVPFPVRACSATSPVFLTVGPVVSGF